jgi:hypothetical protein
VRSLKREELGVLREKRPAVPAVARFRDPHHRLARFFAMGLRTDEIALRCGYSHARVLRFSSDPAFQELVAHYRSLVDDTFKENVDDYLELVKSNMLKAERQIAEKLDKADELDETLPTRELVTIARDAADRVGYSKHTVQVNLNADFAAVLDRAVKRSGKVIDVTPARRSLSSHQHSSPSIVGQGPIRRLA